MAKARSIQLADPSADRPRPQALTTIALAAWALGIVLTLGVAQALPEREAAARAGTPVATTRARPTHASAARPEPTEPPPRSASRPTAMPAPQPLATIAHEASAQRRPVKPEAPMEQRIQRDAQALVSPRDKAREDETPAKRKHAKRSFEMGVVAYTRCDGLERPGTRYPCPRDRKLEDQVWETLERLSQCTAADPGRGAAEVRLTLKKAAAPDVDLKPATSGPSLNLRAISKCAGPKLAQARTRLRSPHAVVSFRFGLK
jgi:hypothetical protein